MIFLLAGTRKQCLDFAADHSLKESEWKYVQKFEDMAGRIGPDSHLLKIGTWYERKDATDAEQYFRAHRSMYL